MERLFANRKGLLILGIIIVAIVAPCCLIQQKTPDAAATGNTIALLTQTTLVANYDLGNLGDKDITHIGQAADRIDYLLKQPLEVSARDLLLEQLSDDGGNVDRWVGLALANVTLIFQNHFESRAPSEVMTPDDLVLWQGLVDGLRSGAGMCMKISDPAPSE